MRLSDVKTGTAVCILSEVDNEVDDEAMML